MSLVVAGRPTNLHLSSDVGAAVVDSDMYNICERIKEISPRLYILDLNDGTDRAYAIMEHCEDGVDRLFKKVAQLDTRVLVDLQRALKIPFTERFKQAEREEEEYKRTQAEQASEELYERTGRPMWTQLERDGFIQRSVSYPKVPRRQWHP